MVAVAISTTAKEVELVPADPHAASALQREKFLRELEVHGRRRYRTAPPDRTWLGCAGWSDRAEHRDLLEA